MLCYDTPCSIPRVALKPQDLLQVHGAGPSNLHQKRKRVMSEQSTPIGDATAHFIALAAQHHFAPQIMDIAKMCLGDYVGVALGALHEPAARAVRRTARSWNSSGGAHILLGPSTAPAVAVLVNGTMGHCMDFDNTHLDGAGHLSTPTWSATLAMAEALGRSEDEALRAFITGFELAARLGAGGLGGRRRVSRERSPGARQSPACLVLLT